MATRIYSGTVVISLNEFWTWIKTLDVLPNNEDNVKFLPPTFNQKENTIEISFEAQKQDQPKKISGQEPDKSKEE